MSSLSFTRDGAKATPNSYWEISADFFSGMVTELTMPFRRDDPKLFPSRVWRISHIRRRFVDASVDEPKQAEWFVAEIR
jgi:hypothetical protein